MVSAPRPPEKGNEKWKGYKEGERSRKGR